ncbi:aldolase [Macellibacteroides fermentans]|uniref:Aldolase n=1 Tax=Macellibacteroides fermentans TaxID=879969 RepID=A0A8E2D6C6_9PORP|nr:aldolase [Macellibacteroides fermentans]NYI50813.1 hypothetical protein [Macellibacteroides fermentans]
MNRGFLDLMFITNNPSVAVAAQDCGVKRIWVDLENLGKEERQKGMNTVKSKHSISDISALKMVVDKSELLVRINPINPDSKSEIDEAIERGADMLMLPMFKTIKEVSLFLQYVNNRVYTNLLFETKESYEIQDKLLEMGGFDEAHIGLNDMHLSYELTFMFELLPNGLVEDMCHKFKYYGIPFGFGGIAKIGEGLLPAERIIAEHYRLGSTRAILSRSFCDNQYEDYNKWKYEFQLGLNQIRLFENLLPLLPESYFKENIEEVKKGVDKVVSIIKAKRNEH